MIDEDSGLYLLGAAYFHEDWQDFAPDADSTVRKFVESEGRETAADAANEIEAALLRSPTEDSLGQIWLHDSHAQFNPIRFGMTHRQWFERMVELLRA